MNRIRIASLSAIFAGTLLCSQIWLQALAMEPKGYMVGLVTVTNKDWVKEYRARNSALLEKYGGRILVRGKPATILEGERPEVDAIVVVEFPSVAQAQAWYSDPEYQPLIELRQTGAHVDFMVFEQLGR